MTSTEMIVLPIFFFLMNFYVSFIPTVGGSCVNQCACEGTVLKCSCSNDTRLLNLIIFNIDPTKSPPNEIYIKECDHVILYQWSSMVGEPLVKMDINDVNILELNSHTIMGQKHIQSFIIRNTGMNLIAEYTLADAENIRQLIFDNVTIPIIQGRAFYQLSHVKEFLFINCNIGVIHAHAFEDVNHVDKFEFKNSKINVLKTEALEMNGVREISFTNLSVNTWQSRAFLPTNVHHVVISHSSIKELDENAFGAKNISVILVHHSRLRHVHSNAFAALENVGKLIIANNSFDKAYKDSFITETDISVYGNRFSCRQNDICSMLGTYSENVNNSFLINATCMAPSAHRGKPILSLDIINMEDDEDACSVEGSGEKPSSTFADTEYSHTPKYVAISGIPKGISVLNDFSTPETKQPPTGVSNDNNVAFCVKINSKIIILSFVLYWFKYMI